MSVVEAAFWVGLTFFGTGLYFMFESKTKNAKKSLGLILMCVGLVGMAFSIVKHFRDRMVTAVASPVQQQSQPQPQPQSQQPSQLVISPGTSISATTNAPDSMAVGINTGTMIKAPPGQPGPGGDALGPMTVKPAWQGVATASVSNITTGTYYVTVSSNRADKIKIDLAY